MPRTRKQKGPGDYPPIVPKGADQPVPISHATPASNPTPQTLDIPPPKDYEVEQDAVRQSQRASRKRGPRITSVYGKQRPAEEYIDIRNEYKDNWFMELDDVVYKDEYGREQTRPHPNIARLLKDPKPGFHYAWPAVTGEGNIGMRHRQNYAAKKSMGIYVPVHRDRLNEGAGAGLITYEGQDTGIYWFMHQLVEVSPAAWKKYFMNPAKAGLGMLARREESYLEEVEQGSQGLATGTLEKHGVNL
jgi:hypothetical protein